MELQAISVEKLRKTPTPKRHIPQIHIKFPDSKLWPSFGSYLRFPLWPKASDQNSFQASEWTAYYRFNGLNPEASNTLSDSQDFYQIFVLSGQIEFLVGDRKVIGSKGDYISGTFSERSIHNCKCEFETLLLIKCIRFLEKPIELNVEALKKLRHLPYLYAHGRINKFRSAKLFGSPFKKGPFTAVGKFPLGSIVSSHYHDPPLFHEFVYIQGGHLTPDGYYAPGDHVTSIPGCKEGPWLATYDPTTCKLPSDWVSFSNRGISKVNAKWKNIFPTASYVYGIIFVHRGPFAKLTSSVRWHTLNKNELGPKG